MSEPVAGQRPTTSPWRRWALRAGLVLGFAATAWVLGSVSASASPPDSAVPALDSLFGPDYSLSALDSVAPALAGGLLESAGEIVDDVADGTVPLTAFAGTDDEAPTEHAADDVAEPSNAAASSPAAAGSSEPAASPTQPVDDVVSTAQKVVVTTVARTSRAASAVVARTEPVLDQARQLAPSADLLNEAVEPLTSAVTDVLEGARAAVVPVGEAVAPTPVANVLHSAIAGVADPVESPAAEIAAVPADTSAAEARRDRLPVAGDVQQAGSGDDAALGPMPSATVVPARGANGVMQGAAAAGTASAPAESGTAVEEALAAGFLAAPTPHRPAPQPPPAAMAPAASSAAGSSTNGGHDYAARLDAAMAPWRHAFVTVRAGVWPAPMDRACEPGFSPG